MSPGACAALGLSVSRRRMLLVFSLAPLGTLSPTELPAKVQPQSGSKRAWLWERRSENRGG